MKFLVTGATGFIGSHVVEQLLRQNQQVIATSTRTAVHVAGECAWAPAVQFIPYEMGTTDTGFFDQIGTPDAVIHLAWQNYKQVQGLHHIEQNYPTNYQFLKTLVQRGIQDITVIGTCFEYGLVEGCLDEHRVTNPITAYGLAKDMLHKSLLILQREMNFSLKWLRPFYLFGPGQHAGTLFAQLDRAINEKQPTFNMSKGEQLRDYLPVQKAAEWIVATAMQKKVDGAINICSGEPISIRSIVENYLIQRNAAVRLNLGYYPYPEYEPMAFWGSTKKIKSVVN